MQTIRRLAYCRAGLVGNPSDGYNGKTIALTMKNFHVEAELFPSPRMEILTPAHDSNQFASIDEMIDHINLDGYYGGDRLIKATIKTFVDYCDVQQSIEPELYHQPFTIRYSTNIPRGVGLAGSSAIVVATIRCLIENFQVTIPQPVQAALARYVENDELGIACGFQDRVAQVYEGLMWMDFTAMRIENDHLCGQYQPVDSSRLPPLYLVYNRRASKSSGKVHGALRNRIGDDNRMIGTMDQIAELVPPAREAIAAGNGGQLHALMDRNFDLRAELYDIRPTDLAMINTARDVGASAKFAGSGGAIIGTFTDEKMYRELCAAILRANPNWKIVRPVVA